MAQVLEAATFEEALTRLPERGPVFIELHAQRLALPNPPRSEVCVAGDFEPRDPIWQVHASPDLDSYLDELVAWVAQRLPADGRFDAKRTLDWLRGEMQDSGVLDGLGAALGLCGLADELSARAHATRQISSAGSRSCSVASASLATVDPEASHATWLRKRNTATMSWLVSAGVCSPTRTPLGTSPVR